MGALYSTEFATPYIPPKKSTITDTSDSSLLHTKV